MSSLYGAPISIEDAKSGCCRARRGAQERLDHGGRNHGHAGFLVYFEKIDGTQSASSVVAVDKARSAALFKRPTKAFQEMLASGGEGLRVLGLTAWCRSRAACR